MNFKHFRVSRAELIIFCWIMILTIYVSTAHCQMTQGSATEIIDGDSFKFRATNSRIYTIRLRGIDAPELTQDYGEYCKAQLQTLILGKPLSARILTADIYGRALAHVWLEGISDLSKRMIKGGCAWEYNAPRDLRKAYRYEQEQAKSLKIGLWEAYTQTYDEENNPIPIVEPIPPVRYRLIHRCEGVTP